jgi:hypothetical protein
MGDGASNIENKGSGDEIRRSNPDSSTSDGPTTGPSGGRMTEGGEAPGPATNEGGETSEAPVSGLGERVERSSGVESRGAVEE